MEQNFIENELVILSKQTLDLFLSQENCSDLISVYTFYYYTAKWQKTNQPKATDRYVMKALHMGQKTLNKAQKFLIDNGIIEKITTRNKKGEINGWYIKLNYIWKNETIGKMTQLDTPPLTSEATSGEKVTNALNANSINALSANIITLNLKQGKTPINRLQSMYGTLFKSLYGFKPTYATYPQTGKCFKELLSSYSEIQLACLLIVFFNWQGMDDHTQTEKDWLVKNTHSIWLFKSNINKYHAYICNVAGWKEEFGDDSKLYKIVQNKLLEII